jgi:hypothetical protein
MSRLIDRIVRASNLDIHLYEEIPISSRHSNYGKSIMVNQ